jgi:hypothetical protein
MNELGLLDISRTPCPPQVLHDSEVRPLTKRLLKSMYALVGMQWFSNEYELVMMKCAE